MYIIKCNYITIIKIIRLPMINVVLKLQCFTFNFSNKFAILKLSNVMTVMKQFQLTKLVSI